MERILSASVKGIQSKLQRTGFFFKFNSNLSLANPSRLSLTLINFLQCSFSSYLLFPNSESHQASTYNHALSRPRWSRDNILASRSKVREFKPGWSRMDFFQDVRLLSTSPLYLFGIQIILKLTICSSWTNRMSTFNCSINFNTLLTAALLCI